ncbi:MAG: 1-deoxy-D-xylulose-5-phosphate synthase [Bifidobacteriaceae bacterium]|nr:1-deoxy-D-xylulose-5-phosphate synthase [Bifidobacteriaceae bacterium]
MALPQSGNSNQMLETVDSPKDLKKIPLENLQSLCDEIRDYLIDILSARGGHVGPNLGAVEATVALHWVFDSPHDKLIFDVSHQSYTHKILTGRKQLMRDLHITREINGYTDFSESEHDHFRMGHTSTSISLASGLAKARDLKGENFNIVAFIGDGSLSGGEAFEGLNIGANLKSNFIVVANDNEFSIDTNSGGLYSNLAHLRQTNGDWTNNYFKALGYEYFYIENGNSVVDLVKAFEAVKDCSRPVVVHIHTQKGKGLPYAEADPTSWHYSAPFNKSTGVAESHKTDQAYESTAAITNDFLDKELSLNKKSLVLIPGAPGLGADLKKKYPSQYVDTGIAEVQAVAMASGAAKAGAKPYLFVNSPFVQRAYDQTIIDWALQETPAVMLVSWAGISDNDYTHVGMYDIAMLSNVPGLTYLAPASADEYRQMLEFSRSFDKPLAIRLGLGNLPKTPDPKIASGENEKIEYGKSVVTKRGSKVAIFGLGDYFEKAQSVDKILREKGFNPTLINPRFINVLDFELLDEIAKNHSVIVTLENGIIDGGFGQKIAGYYSRKSKNIKVFNFGAKTEFINNEPFANIMDRYHLNPEQIVEDIKPALENPALENES